jgi:hypothetical protein
MHLVHEKLVHEKSARFFENSVKKNISAPLASRIAVVAATDRR